MCNPKYFYGKENVKKGSKRVGFGIYSPKFKMVEPPYRKISALKTSGGVQCFSITPVLLRDECVI